MIDFHLYVARSHAQVGRREIQAHIHKIFGIVFLVLIHLPEAQEILIEGFEEFFLHGLVFAEFRLFPLDAFTYIPICCTIGKIIARGRHLGDVIAYLSHGGRIFYHPLGLTKEQKHFLVSFNVDFGYGI
jgi:hypothetical protein